MLRQTVDGDRVGERSRHRFVDKQRLAGPQHGQRLLQVRPAVVRLKQHHVDPSHQFLEVVDHFDAHRRDLFGVVGHPRHAAGDVGAALGIHERDASASNTLRIGLHVEHLGEGQTVRRVEADHANRERLPRRLFRPEVGRQKRVGLFSLRYGEVVAAVGMDGNETVCSPLSLIGRLGRGDRFLDSGTVEVAVVQRSVHEQAAGGQRRDELRKVERHSGRIAAELAGDPWHVSRARPSSEVALFVVTEGREPAARHDRLEAVVEHGREDCVVPSQRMPDAADAIWIDLRKVRE